MSSTQNNGTTTAEQRSLQQSLRALVVRPIEQFVALASQGGVLLVLATVLAIIWSNSRFADVYQHLWPAELSLGFGTYLAKSSLQHIINDGLMSMFFLVVGLEIKRELIVGELNSWRRALVPVLAAVGGMLVPAVIYLAVQESGDTRVGFGIPMATDIAFSLALIRALGGRVPALAIVLLTALAIIDDLGAIIVIAVFYGQAVDTVALATAGAMVAVLFAMNRGGVRKAQAYMLVGIPLWFSLHSAGLHPTLAGVIVGMCVPANTRFSRDAVVAEAQALLHNIDICADADLHDTIRALESRMEEHESPLARMERALHPWVSYLVLPLFALANAGISLAGMAPTMLMEPVAVGVILGLVAGKQIGVFGMLWFCVKTKLLELPERMGLLHLWGIGCLAGIGFTMSLFVAALAFDSGSAAHLQAKAAIIVGSALSAACGTAVLLLASVRHRHAINPPTDDGLSPTAVGAENMP